MIGAQKPAKAGKGGVSRSAMRDARARSCKVCWGAAGAETVRAMQTAGRRR